MHLREKAAVLLVLVLGLLGAVAGAGGGTVRPRLAEVARVRAARPHVQATVPAAARAPAVHGAAAPSRKPFAASVDARPQQLGDTENGDSAVKVASKDTRLDPANFVVVIVAALLLLYCSHRALRPPFVDVEKLSRGKEPCRGEAVQPVICCRKPCTDQPATQLNVRRCASWRMRASLSCTPHSCL